jgi:hypothetical protein
MTPPTWLGIVVNPAGVDLRTHPDPHAPVIRTIVRGDGMRVHGVPLQGSEWYAATYGAQSGYVAVGDIRALYMLSDNTEEVTHVN